MVDINKLTEPVTPEAPSGKDLEYDSEFLDLVSSATHIPARKMGNDEIAAVEPVWTVVCEKAEALLSKSKDLRITVLLTRGLLHKRGFEGLEMGLEILSSLLGRYWDSIHPLPDPDDKDMTMRLNALSELGEYDFGVRKISELPLISVRGLGDFGLKSVEEAKQNSGLQSEIDAAISKSDPGELAAREAHIAGSIRHLGVIQKLLSDKAENIAKIDTLATTLKKAQAYLSTLISSMGGNGPATTPSADSGGEGITQVGQSAPLSSSAPTAFISSPEDVKRSMDLICDYYERNEPSSPVPILLKRAKGLVSKTFMEILEDISPEGVKQLKVLKGPDKKG